MRVGVWLDNVQSEDVQAREGFLLAQVLASC
jgi:hypothetical protein